MPFYEYKCSDCGFELEELQKISDPPLKQCPNCGKDKLQKLIGKGAGLIFKGSGFYLTDYRKNKSTDKSVTGDSVSKGISSSKSETLKNADTTTDTSKSSGKNISSKDSKSAVSNTAINASQKSDNKKKD